MLRSAKIALETLEHGRRRPELPMQGRARHWDSARAGDMVHAGLVAVCHGLLHHALGFGVLDVLADEGKPGGLALRDDAIPSMFALYSYFSTRPSRRSSAVYLQQGRPR